jgi:hypothetical protein
MDSRPLGPFVLSLSKDQLTPANPERCPAGDRTQPKVSAAASSLAHLPERIQHQR